MRILLTEMIPMVRKLGRFDFYNPSTYSYRWTRVRSQRLREWARKLKFSTSQSNWCR
jgi:hypothetical protein